MKKFSILFILFILSFSAVKAQSYSDFTLPNLEGDDVSLSEMLKKGPVMISFWATWCSPCKEEMEKMNGIYNKYKEQGFQYIAINQDSPKSLSKVKSFIEGQRYDFPVVLDTDKKVFEAYNGQGIPYSIIIDSNQNVTAVHVGYVTGDDKKIEKEIQDILVKK